MATATATGIDSTCKMASIEVLSTPQEGDSGKEFHMAPNGNIIGLYRARCLDDDDNPQTQWILTIAQTTVSNAASRAVSSLHRGPSPFSSTHSNPPF
jgi:hypothetical protein